MHTERCMMHNALWLAVGFVLVTTVVIAQDSHYWTNQYGTKSWLLGGAVVGAASDLASTYYNPASVAMMPDTSSLLTAITLNWNRTKLQPKDVDFMLRSSGTSPLPTLVSINLPLSLLGSRSLQFSYLQRSHDRSDLFGTGTSEPGAEEQYVASGQVNRQLYDSWFGITWSKQLSSKHALGVTAYVSGVSSEYTAVISTTVTSPDTTASSSYAERIGYDNIRLLGKIGYYYDGRPLSLGIVVTTPSVKLFNTYGNSTISGASTVNGSVTGLFQDAQSGLTSTYQTPISVAVGGTWYTDKTSYYLTIEWFDGLDPYRPLTPSSFTTTIPGTTIDTYGSTIERYGIVNIAIGIKHQVAEHTFLYGSIIRDGSSVNSADQSSDVIVNYDLYHGTLGWQFMIDQTTITLGGIIGGGWVNDAPPTQFERFEGLPGGISVDRSFLRIGFLLGVDARF